MTRRPLIAQIAANSIASFCIVLVSVSVAHAQAFIAGANSDASEDITIVTTPAAPAPGQTVTLTVESSLLDIDDSAITWYDNGTVIGSGTGKTAISIVAGALGHESDITASLVAPDGTNASSEAIIIPTEVDLLVDSDSYVPPFYLGRALPSAGTDLRLQAIAHLRRPDGSLVPSSDITYTWKQDGRVIGTVSGLGKATAILPAPILYGTSDIEVDVQSDDAGDGTLSGSASLSIPATTPVLALYEDNPLLGLMYYDELGSQMSIPDSEMTFAAVPYFAQIQSPNDPRLAYAWTVNGASVAASADDPSELTLNGSGSNGQAAVGLSVTHSTNIFLSASGQWNITLGSRASGSQGGSSGVTDPFSGQTE